MAIMAAVKIGRRVKEERVRKFMTQERLAAAASISSTQLVRIELNQVEPHFSTILKLAEALEVDPSELVEEE